MAELHVSKKNIAKLFSEMENRKFIIPDFQRPYKWDTEKCETLWNDIVVFFENSEATSDYFLGTIVTSEIEKSTDLDIIDGQQRVTSFMLLLRAFYKKLQAMPEDDDVNGLKSQVGPCIWDVDPISKKVKDFDKIHIFSDVATEEDNETFHSILKTGEYDKEKTDNYSLNYAFFKQKCDKYAMDYPLKWYTLCVTILNRCIVLPIECTTQETALTIFSTLNDRGLPLSDSDIFKAQIYKNKSNNERTKFTEDWKELTEICKKGNFTIDDVFRYYSHVLRAREDDKSKEIGLRKFYSGDNYKKLKDATLMKDIMSLAEFWYYINTREEVDEELNYNISKETRKRVHILSHYPNEYWKYVTSVFFITNKDNVDFDTTLVGFLDSLTAFLFAKFINAPTVNAIKDDIYNACIDVKNGNGFLRIYTPEKEKLLKDLEDQASARLMRPLLLLDAYRDKNQTELIPTTFDIEHIFPKKWQETSYQGWNEEDAVKYLDRFGNKIVLEKKLNIQVSNDYFGKKKEKYKNSKIAVVKELSEYPKNHWGKVDIEEREEKFKNRIWEYLTIHLNN